MAFNNKNNINISANNVKGKCELKCAYNFAYTEGQMNISNNGSTLSLLMEPQTSAPVTYNQEKYKVTKMYLVSPSIHIFDGGKVDAELVIEHIPVLGGNSLHVAVPLLSSGETSIAILDEIVSNAPTNATEEMVMMVDLTSCVPIQPFFSYTQPDKNIDWIVFGKLFALQISSNTLEKLQALIQPFAYSTPGKSLFYNSLGPNTVSHVGDGIYISCTPTGSSTEEIGVTQTHSNFSSNSNSLTLSKKTIKLIFTILGLVLFFVCIFIALKYGYKRFLE